MVVSKCMINKLPRKENYINRLQAAKELNGMAYKLYTYLESKEETEFIYKRNDFIKMMNTTIKSADAAFSELVENNFLIPKNELTYFFNIKEKNTNNNI